MPTRFGCPSLQECRQTWLVECRLPARDGVDLPGRPTDHENRRVVRGRSGSAEQSRIAHEHERARRRVDRENGVPGEDTYIH